MVQALSGLDAEAEALEMTLKGMPFPHGAFENTTAMPRRDLGCWLWRAAEGWDPPQRPRLGHFQKH